MSWEVTDAGTMAHSPARVVQVGVPTLDDRVDYAEVVGKSFQTPADLDFFASGGVLMLCTSEGIQEMQRLTERAGLLRREGLAAELRRLALTHKAVCLRWVADRAPH